VLNQEAFGPLFNSKEETTMDITEAHKTALRKAKIALMDTPDSSFFASICFSMKHVWDDTVSTACTDGTTIYWGPKFFLETLVDAAERVFVMIHETLHVAYFHPQRLQSGMCHDRANIAMDHVINLQLIERGFKAPTKFQICADPQFKGMSWEQVYKLLPDNPGKPLMKDVRPGSGDPIKSEQLTQEIQDILVRASIQSKMDNDKPGTIPGDIQIYLNGLLDPKLPWHRILQKYLNTFSKNDYSFRKLNRRFFPDHYMPSFYGEKLMDLTIAVDISGSVSNADFHVFVSEIASILRMMKPSKITLIQFDTAIKSIDEVHNIEELMGVKFTGRGGTEITPVLEWANKNKPQLLMMFTDGEFRFPKLQTKSAMLWLIHNNNRFTAPFGKVIHYSI
jgi:predicted metal-dependent peptidase